jgi:ABC-2 type transport system ATP-binding protein
MNALEISDLKKIYKTGFFRKETVAAVNGLSFNVRKGDIYGFLGPNGSGKTTTLMSVMGFITPTSGKILVLGDSPGSWKSRERIGFLPDNPVLYPYLSGYNALYVVGRMFLLSHAEINKRIGALADELGMDRELRLPVAKHSRGMRQRIGFAQALINDPELLIMDEPMNGLDPMGRKMFRDVIMKRREKGKTVFFSSHILSDIEMICDRICVIRDGGIIYENTMKGISESRPGETLEDIFMSMMGSEK